MINAVGRDIPKEILEKTGKEVFQGVHHFDGHVYRKHGPLTQAVINSNGSKLVDSIHDVLVKCGIKDGMTVSFHHHFREGDYVVNMVMGEIHKMGIKDITICASSLGKAHDPIVPYIEDGTVTNIYSSGVRGKIGEAISNGKLKGLAVMQSHGGRVRSLVTGEKQIDIAFIGAPTCDEYGNCRGIGGNSNCGVLSYAMADSLHADKVVAITDCLVPFPNFPAHISMTRVDYVVKVDAIGDPKKIATGAAKPTTDQRKLMMADYCTKFVVNSPYFKDGFSYQTGVGGASIASTVSLAKEMKERKVRMRFGVGGLTKPMCDLLINDQVDCLLDTQDFDLDAVESVKNLKHFRISAGQYADPFNKGAVVNKLDFVILAALEVDVNFNCNVVVGSDGIITGAQGGHPDTAAGAKCAIVIAPLLQGRIPAICTDVTTVTTPGESVDVVITDYGIAINPRRQDLIEAMKDVDLPFKTIEELRDIAYSIAGEPEKVQFEDRVVGIIESRDGTIMDVVRRIKPFQFTEGQVF
ncbi:citrate lyase subunit alpha [Enterocloster clostridioformis]|uniref:citrate lyase subunit alpha n=2 Tax=Enterocloster clostridioformis TaxID=1531 RepID=UPI00080C3B63|nr:citrate lyase subunit alpha [Enterocloster clostridioformis]ANU46653.1 citrate lyase subunit alpha [Lachnoclostridium sp. YL32]NDO31514.1 citrate lyase subunit alpha [Enterocloster clostridioformis]OXE65360.1 citrate lyase subunit alpha [Enterocloster clostridioformis]QQQ98631.1 citrate lyase subunit alpha [Enterocloster clostridioformis]